MKNLLSILTPALLAVALAGCGDAAPAPAAAAQVDDGSADMAAARAALSAQDKGKAQVAFAAAAEKNPTNFEARLQLALVDLALGDVPGAQKAAAEATALRPASAEAWLADGQAAYLKRDYARARTDFQAVAGTKGLPGALRAQAYVALGVVELAQNHFDASHVAFLRAMRFDRRNPAVWYHLGILSRNTYHFEVAAQSQFEMAARLLDPRDPRAHRISREILPALRASITAAAAAIPGVAQRNPGQAAKLIPEGDALAKRKSFRNALKKYEAAFKADPFSDVAALRYAQLLEAHDKTAAGVDKALAAYRAAIEQRPERQALYLAAGRLAYANKRWATAASIMTRAVAHDPESRPTIDLLVASLQKAGKPSQAALWQAYRREL